MSQNVLHIRGKLPSLTERACENRDRSSPVCKNDVEHILFETFHSTIVRMNIDIKNALNYNVFSVFFGITVLSTIEHVGSRLNVWIQFESSQHGTL